MNKLQFVKENIKYAGNGWDTDKFYTYLLGRRVEAETGYTLESNDYKYSVPSLGLSFDKDTDAEEILKSLKSDTAGDSKALYSLGYYAQNLRVGKKIQNKFTFKMDMSHYKYALVDSCFESLYCIFDYIINGYVEEDRRKWMSKEDSIANQWPDFKRSQQLTKFISGFEYDFEDLGITVKAYQNGRIDVSGITDEQYKKANDLIEKINSNYSQTGRR